MMSIQRLMVTGFSIHSFMVLHFGNSWAKISVFFERNKRKTQNRSFRMKDFAKIVHLE
jgi:hypothetical protein